MPAPRVFHFDSLPMESLLGGSWVRSALKSDGALVTLNWLRSDFPRLPAHRHPFDQLSFVFTGTLMLAIEDVEYELPPGSAIVIPANALHTAWILGEETVLNVDVFAPPREDYLFLAAHQDDES